MEPDFTEDEDLVRRAASGEEAALCTLMAKFTPLLQTTVRGYQLCAADERDVLQDVWILLWQNLDNIRHPARIAGWLRTTAHRQAMRLSRLRRREYAAQRPAELAVARDPYVPEAHAVHEDCLRVLRDATRGLLARERDLAAAIAYEPEITYAQLAQRIGVEAGSVGQLRARCLRKLRKMLLEQGIAGPGV